MEPKPQEMLSAINGFRGIKGLKPLIYSSELAAAAQRHSDDMARNPGAGIIHIGTDGSDGGRRIRESNYNAIYWLEMVGWGFGGNVIPMLDYWNTSPDHWFIPVDTTVTEIGIGYSTGMGVWGHYWVVNLGHRKSIPEQPAPVPPAPYTSHIPVVTASPKPAGIIDMLPYICGDGRTYRVGNASGSFEIFQSQMNHNEFWQIKAWDNLSVVNYESFDFDSSYIYRDIDTSPGAGRYYRHSFAGTSAPWVWRFMAPGNICKQHKNVQFYRQDNCDPIPGTPSGDVVDSIKFVAKHERFTFPARDWQPVTLNDVIELEWIEGGETYYYARYYGLVGWARKHQDPNSPAWSAISEMRPEIGRLDKLRIPCMEE